MERPSAWKHLNDEQLLEMETLTEAYRRFISNNKTERACVASAIELAKQHGYRDITDVLAAHETLKAGDKIYAAIHKKALMLVNLGSDSLENGLNILGAHIDSPRLDLKQNPLYEESDLAYLDTHYYGGVKSYHWVATPLALQGVICKKDGTTIEVNIGDKPSDPIFCISDLLIHLAADQLKKPAAEAIEHEALDLLVGGRPLKVEGDEAEKRPVAAYFLKLLAETYQVDEEDFLSAELEVVPAGEARELGLDRSMIMGYGQDDRVCAYTSLIAQLGCPQVKRTSVCLLVDKEEIGSVGATGMTSRFFENTMAEILNLTGNNDPLTLRRMLAHSRMLSSDVSAGFDPLYADRFEKKNSALLGHGLCFNKYTGARGKGGSNDANAEYMALIRDIMDSADICFQTCELGRVNAGGGGTIAYILAEYGMDVIDSGVAVLSMHSLWEVASKVDIYEAYRGYKAFLERS
ncbi:aminopeptidase [Collinsella sp. zg1085]|uniref:aminopeptidase n=1 Tax=Collinsella sp. zg1085 TaxID=2844380 RepID=UPI001C0E1B0D|nr:aminopeptidase [Collinsella sp. zg1085]QWT17224.1 aminopeptidase [Collinsella sp. zg1085]